MRSTLFFIPHEIGGIPLFGMGLLLGGLAVGCCAWWLWSAYHRRPLTEIVAGLPLWFLAAAVVAFVLPAVEVTTPGGTVIGLPIRGYGVMVLAGLLCGIGITVHRGRQLGIAPDTIIGLGFWMMLGGVLGARAFYVIQKWDSFDSLLAVVMLTEGGLVIYGGVLGGIVSGAIYCARHRMHLPSTADLIAPGFLLGLCLGRVGCLLHGCCFGGICTANLPSIQFPAGSVPYEAQMARGQLLGIEFGPQRKLPAPVIAVRPDSPAAQRGIRAGDVVESIIVRALTNEPADRARPSPGLVTEIQIDQRLLSIGPSDMPAWSLPVHPSQIYASINALLLCTLIWYWQLVATRDGATFLLAIVLYACSRFLLEGIRSDEAGQLGTSLTIAQWLAIGSGISALAMLMWLVTRPKRRVWRWPTAAI